MPPPFHTLNHHRSHRVSHKLHTDAVYLEVVGCECSASKKMTPLRIHLRGYFASTIGEKEAAQMTRRKKVKPLYSREALTTDDISQRLEDEKQKRNKYFELKNSWGCCPNLNYLLSSIAGIH